MSTPNMDRYHEGPSLRGHDDETAHLKELAAEDAGEDMEDNNGLCHEQESLGWAFKKKDKP